MLPVFGHFPEVDYPLPEYDKTIEILIKTGTRTDDHQELNDPYTLLPLGLVKQNIHLNDNATDENIRAVIESMHNLATFAKIDRYLLPPENDRTLTKRRRTTPHQVCLVTNPDDRYDTFLKTLQTAFGY